MYIFSTLDSPCDTQLSSTFATDSAPRATKPLKINSNTKTGSNQDASLDNKSSEEDQEEEETDRDELEDDEDAEVESNYLPDVPTIMPRRRYVGARNVETVKDGKLMFRP